MGKSFGNQSIRSGSDHNGLELRGELRAQTTNLPRAKTTSKPSACTEFSGRHSIPLYCTSWKNASSTVHRSYYPDKPTVFRGPLPRALQPEYRVILLPRIRQWASGGGGVDDRLRLQVFWLRMYGCHVGGVSISVLHTDSDTSLGHALFLTPISENLFHPSGHQP